MGRPSFLPMNGRAVIQTRKRCQCPERGDLHFYETTKKTNEWIFRCVNALNGATFISTLASGNPCKSRLCGSIFPEVFQNIPKKAFLKGVFWKFTICSYLTVPFLLLVYLFFLGLRSTFSTLLVFAELSPVPLHTKLP